jgi:predicted Zn-dependent protease with MMP-like domain
MSQTGFIGYAYPYFNEVIQNLPDSLTLDGVVIDYQTLPGGSSSDSLGLNLVHEIGHWLGLLHTFEPNSLETTNQMSY